MLFPLVSNTQSIPSLHLYNKNQGLDGKKKQLLTFLWIQLPKSERVSLFESPVQQRAVGRVWVVGHSSQLPCKSEAVVVKPALYITGSGECVCLVNLIKQQVQKSGHMALMCPVRGWQLDNDSNMKKFAYICIG